MADSVSATGTTRRKAGFLLVRKPSRPLGICPDLSVRGSDVALDLPLAKPRNVLRGQQAYRGLAQ